MDRMAEDGSLFHMANATPGTGIAQTANTTSDTTKPFIVMVNPVTSTKRVYLHRLILRPTAVSSGQTTQNIDVFTCDGIAYASAGTDYLAAASGIATAGYRQLRSGHANASVLSVIRVGVPVTVLGTTPRLLAHYLPRQTTIPVIGDTYTMHFGSLYGTIGPGNTPEPVSTTVNQYARQFPPIIVDPGTSCLIIPWAASIGGAMSWEFDFDWSEN